MTVTDTYKEATNKWFELANDTYQTYVKSVVWGQEQVLGLTKTIADQSKVYQVDTKGLTEEYKNQVEKVQQLTQTLWQDMLKNTTEVVNQYRVATNANLTDLNERIDELQNRIEAVIKPAK